MPRSLPTLAALACLAALTHPRGEEDPPPPPARDFASLHTELAEAWEQEHYGRGLGLARQLVAMVGEKRNQVVMASLPPAPAGFALAPRAPELEEQNPFANLLMGLGNVIERRYVESRGEARLDLILTADSPMLQMFRVWTSKPESLGDGARLIHYGKHPGVLRGDSQRATLQIMIGHTLCEARAYGRDADFLQAFLDQEAVARIAEALSR
jgi:hypothetical protein